MKYFKPDKEWQFNSRITTPDNKWFFYSEGFMQATEVLEKQVLDGNSNGQDFLIYPYCFLIRHYIEIGLKEIIVEGREIIEGNDNNIVKGNHDLMMLWNESQKVLKEVRKEGYEKAPKEVEDFIYELHSIDVKSDAFRYPIDKKGNNNLEQLEIINFKTVAKGFERVKSYIFGITSLIEEEKKN